MHLVHFPFVPAIWIFLSPFTLILCIFSEAVAANCFSSRIILYLEFFLFSARSIFLMLPPFDGTSNGPMVSWEVFNQLFQDFNKTSAQVINNAQPKKTLLKTIQYTIKWFFLKWDVFVVCLMPNAYCRWQNTAINSGARLLLNFPHISPKLSFRN